MVQVIFLEKFLEEYSRLKVTGMKVMDKVFTVSIKFFICDAPARSFLQCINTRLSLMLNMCGKRFLEQKNHLYTPQLLPNKADEAFSQVAYGKHQIKLPLIDSDILCKK